MESLADNSQEYLKKKWCFLRKFLGRPGPFCHPDFEPSPDTLKFVMTSCKVLVIGAGGLGCELLKNLAFMGFTQIHVIDMDTIDLSNLNRQFLFRRKDIGQPKADIAAKFINSRVPNCSVTPHFKKIQDFDEEFYRQFHIVVSGLDSIVARRWMNSMLLSLLSYSDDGELDQSTLIPMVDGGTEGFKGNARVILPGITACVDCTLDLFPPQVTYPLCTIANTPRLPEHCIEYVKVIQWPKENPFETNLDGDDPTHLNWVFEKSQERASQFNIAGVTYRLVQGVVKNIIPAVASTNAVIAAACASEVFKLATSCCLPLNNYMVFNDVDGIYTYTYEAERRPDCLACSQTPVLLSVEDCNIKLEQLIERLTDSHEYQMKNPGIRALIKGETKTLYIPTVASIEEQTRPNLKKTLGELNLTDGCQILVADLTTPNPLQMTLKYSKLTEMVVD